MKKTLLAATAVGTAAYLGSKRLRPRLTAATAPALDQPRRPEPTAELRPAPTVKAPTAEEPRPTATRRGAGLLQTKKILLALMAIGAAAFFSNVGTFASFSAETSNPGSSLSSGTLTMSDNGCASYGTGSVGNVNPSCSAILTAQNLAPGVFGGSAKVTLKNTGSLDAARFYLYAPQSTTTLSGSLTPTTASVNIGTGGIAVGATTIPLASGLANALSLGTSITLASPAETVTTTADAASGATSLTVTAVANAHAAGTAVTYPKPISIPTGALTAPLASGQSVVVKSGSTFDTLQLDQAAATGATSVHVDAPLAAPHTYASGASLASVDCQDARTTTSPVSGATYGSQLNFNTLANNPLCGAALMSIQEVDSNGNTYCWYGLGSSQNGSNGGMCTAPVSSTISTAIANGASPATISLTSLNGNIKSGDTLTISENSCTQNFQSAAAYYTTEAAATISITGLTATCAYDTNATVVDTTELTTLNSDTSDTITSFDTLHPQSSQIALEPLTGNGAVDANAPVWLGKAGGSNDTRTFYVNVYLPKPSGIVQNSLQGLSSTFGLTWHLDQ